LLLDDIISWKLTGTSKLLPHDLEKNLVW